MNGFSDAEFKIMIEELVGRDHSSFDMLCYIAEKTLRPTVRNWCFNDPALKGKGVEDDIMQEIQAKLIKSCVSGFILRDDRGGSINYDPEGFRSWLFTVALNVKKDFSNRQRRTYFNERGFEEGEEVVIPDVSEDAFEISQERNLLLKRAFAIVIESDVQVYKVLTWIAQFLFVLQLDTTKIKSNELIIEAFEKKTLFEMYDMIICVSKILVWLEVTDEQRNKIECALRNKWDEDRVIGQVKYSEFYMKKGAKPTISDWVNRMNNLIKRVMGNDAFNG